MMDKTIEGVEKLADAELKMANEQHPLFASNHEGAAVILEEVEEAEIELNAMKNCYELLWHEVKSDDPTRAGLWADSLKRSAIRCAAECIQVAAMSEKIKMSGDKNHA